MKIQKSNKFLKSENIKYHYVFKDLVYHKDAGHISYGISKTNYFMSGKSFYQNVDMFQEIISNIDDNLRNEFISYPIPKRILEEYKKL